MFRSTRKTLKKGNRIFGFFFFSYSHCMYIYIQTTGESLFPHSRQDLMVLLTTTFTSGPATCFLVYRKYANQYLYLYRTRYEYIHSCSHLVRTLAHVPFVFEHNVTTTVTITFVVIPGATIPTRACHVISSPKQTFAHQHLAIPTHNS